MILIVQEETISNLDRFVVARRDCNPRRKRSFPTRTNSIASVMRLVTVVCTCSSRINILTNPKSTHAYAPHLPLQSMHPTTILTTTTVQVPPAVVSIPPKKTLYQEPILNKQPRKSSATSSSSSSSSASSILTTPSVDQLELHQLLRRQRHNTTATLHNIDRPDGADLHSTVSMRKSTTKTTTTVTTRNQQKRTGPSRKPSGRVAASTLDNHTPKHYVPLLTAAEEVEYSYRIRTLRAALRIREQLVSYQNDIYIHPTEQQWCVACGCTSLRQLRRIIYEGQMAKTQLISANTGLVVRYAKTQYTNLKYAMEAGGGVGTILTLSDIIQEGHFGLIEAAERYQPEKGFRFSTYATYWVKQRILRCISDSSRTIRLPVHVHETLYKIKKAKRTLHTTMGREPTVTELSQYLDISEDRIRTYTKSSRNVISLERPLSGTGGSTSSSGSNSKGSTVSTSGTHSPSSSNSGGMSSGKSSGGSGSGSGSMTEDTRTLLDTIPSDGPTPEEDAVLDSMRRDIQAVLDTELVDLEQQVVRCRFGLLYNDDTSIENNKNKYSTAAQQPHGHSSTIRSGESYSIKETSQLLQISMDRVRLLEARALNKLRHPMRNYKLKEYVQGYSPSTVSTVSPPSLSTSGSTNSRLRPNSTSSPKMTMHSPIQQWMSFQQSEYSRDDNDNDHNSNGDVMTKSRLEEAYANSPSLTNNVATNRISTSEDRSWHY
jgi:RNA polymerase primary sigma factor